MKLRSLYAFRYVTHNIKQVLTTAFIIMIAICVMSVCSMSADSMNYTFLINSLSQSGGYNFGARFDSHQTYDSFMQKYGGLIISSVDIDIAGNVSGYENLFISSAEALDLSAGGFSEMRIDGRLPSVNEILINGTDSEMFGKNLKVGDIVTVSITLLDGNTIKKTLTVSGIYYGESDFITYLPFAFVSSDVFSGLLDTYAYEPTFYSYIITTSAATAERINSDVFGNLTDFKNGSVNIDFNDSYNLALKGGATRFLYIIMAIADIAAVALLLCIQIGQLRGEIDNFELLRDLGTKEKTIYQIIFLRNGLICIPCIPPALLLAGLLVRLISKLSRIQFTFHVSVLPIFVILFSVFFVMMLSSLLALLSVNIQKDRRSMRIGKTVVRIKERGVFSAVYAARQLFQNYKENLLLAVSVAAFLCCCSLFLFLVIIVKPFITRSYNYLENAPLINVYIDGDSNITDEQLERIQNIDNVILTGASGYYYNDTSDLCWNMDIYIVQCLDDKKISAEFSETRLTDYLRADINYQYPESDEISELADNAVEGDVYGIYKSGDTLPVAVIDNYWTEEGEDCYHPGDIIYLRKCVFDKEARTYTPSDSETVALTVTAVIKTEEDCYNNMFQFPLYVSCATYEAVTGFTGYKDLDIFCQMENHLAVMHDLKNIIYELHSDSYYIRIRDMVSWYYDDTMLSVQVLDVITMEIIILLLLFSVSLLLFYRYRTDRRKNEVWVLKSLGITNSGIIRSCVWEAVIQSIFESLVFCAIAGFLNKAVFDLYVSSGVIIDTVWTYPWQLVLSLSGICILFNILSACIPMTALLNRWEDKELYA